MKTTTKPLLIALGVGLLSMAGAEEQSTAKDQTSLHLTIYNSNLAMIKDQRQLTLPVGKSTLAFKEVSANIRPNTAILDAAGVTLLEQNFEYDLLTPESLLNQFVGKKVTLERYEDKKVIRETAEVLANNNGAVLKVGDQIRTHRGVDNLIFDDVPDDLRDRPTLTMRIDNKTVEKQAITLSYLTHGLNWSADYVAAINDDNTLNLKGWVTLDNSSGTTYKNAKLQLVAGEVNQVPEAAYLSKGKYRAKAAPMMASASMADVAEESLFEYHLYSLSWPTTIKNKQQKQVSLLEAKNVPYKKQLLINSYDPYGWQRWYSETPYQELKADAKLIIDNKKVSQLGMPLPAGTIRTYQKDSQGNAQFIGEDRIKHTPENERVTLKLGEAFDVTAKRKQTDYKSERQVKQNAVAKVKQTVTTASYEVVFKNAKDSEVTVDYQEHFADNWTISEQSLPSKKLSSSVNHWAVNIPAKGETKLTYTLVTKH